MGTEQPFRIPVQRVFDQGDRSVRRGLPGGRDPGQLTADLDDGAETTSNVLRKIRLAVGVSVQAGYEVVQVGEQWLLKLAVSA